MKTLLVGAAAIALIAGAGAASAQMYQPAPAPVYQTYQTYQGPVQPMQQTMPIAGTPSWMIDDGSSSDHPIHNPGDISGEWLNREYSGGLYTAPGTGFPAYPGQDGR